MQLAQITLLARALICALLLCLASCTDTVQLKPLGIEKSVLAFGDSITFGSGANHDQSYPAQLAQLINRKVVNAGVPGELSDDGVERLASVLDKHQPALLILCHGGNDFLKRKPLATTKANIRRMITMAKARNIDVVLIATPTPGLFLSVPPFYYELADEFDIAHEDDIIAHVESQVALKSDAVHPNAKGYRLIAEKLAELLREHGAY